MKCVECKNEILNPLIDSNMNSYCENCYSPTLGYIDMYELAENICYTAENIELFSKSEILFNEYPDRLSEAIELCYLSAVKGNPNAIINLGYYLENGIYNANNKERFNKALECYLAIIMKSGDAELNRIIHNNRGLNRDPNKTKDKEIKASVINNIRQIAIHNAICLMKNYNVSGAFDNDQLLKYLIDIVDNKEQYSKISKTKISEKQDETKLLSSAEERLQGFIEKIEFERERKQNEKNQLLCHYKVKIEEVLNILTDAVFIKIQKNYRIYLKGANTGSLLVSNYNDLKNKIKDISANNGTSRDADKVKLVICLKTKDIKKRKVEVKSTEHNKNEKNYYFTYNPDVVGEIICNSSEFTDGDLSVIDIITTIAMKSRASDIDNNFGFKKYIEIKAN